VRRVSDIISEITAASREQSMGIEQINQAIMQMDSVTQQNAALVEESAAAAESLQGQATQLAEVVGRFVLDPALQQVDRSGGRQSLQRGVVPNHRAVVQRGAAGRGQFAAP
jgi:methyl-accepting chemotaxis protein